MAESKRTAPHFYVSVDVRADALLALRQRLARRKVQVSVNDLLIRGLALAAVEHPQANAAYVGDRLYRFDRVDVGAAIATDNGLLSPAVLDCASKPLEQIAVDAPALGVRVR